MGVVLLFSNLRGCYNGYQVLKMMARKRIWDKLLCKLQFWGYQLRTLTIPTSVPIFVSLTNEPAWQVPTPHGVMRTKARYGRQSICHFPGVSIIITFRWKHSINILLKVKALSSEMVNGPVFRGQPHETTCPFCSSFLCLGELSGHLPCPRQSET